jgi:hypothetical protein
VAEEVLLVELDLMVVLEAELRTAALAEPVALDIQAKEILRVAPLIEILHMVGEQAEAEPEVHLTHLILQGHLPLREV